MMAVSLYTSRVVLKCFGSRRLRYLQCCGRCSSHVYSTFRLTVRCHQPIYHVRIGKRKSGKPEQDILVSDNHPIGAGRYHYPIGRNCRYLVSECQNEHTGNTNGSSQLGISVFILIFAINLISVPYNASIVAHEKMSAFAYISILEAIGKTGHCLPHCSIANG